MQYLSQIHNVVRVCLLEGRHLPQRIKREIFVLQPALFKIYLPIFAFLILIWVAIRASGISSYYFVADPAEITGQQPYIGAVSIIGNLAWCAIATVCCFTVSLLPSRTKSEKMLRRFILLSGLFSAFFLLDDTFQIHESVYDLIFANSSTLPERERLYRDIVEMSIFALYGCIFTAYLLYFKPVIKSTEVLFLILSLLFFGLSTVVDMTHKRDFLEESLKLLGILSWCIYFFRFCKQTIAQNLFKQRLESLS